MKDLFDALILFGSIVFGVLFITCKRPEPQIPTKWMTYKEYRKWRGQELGMKAGKVRKWYKNEIDNRKELISKGIELKPEEDPEILRKEYLKWNRETYELHEKWRALSPPYGMIYSTQVEIVKGNPYRMINKASYWTWKNHEEKRIPELKTHYE